MPAITQLGGEFRIVEAIARREDHRTYFQFFQYRGLLMIDGFPFTDLNTEMAL
jgi:hypothetical protein